MIGFDYALHLAAWVCFVLAAFGVSRPRMNLVAAGLALYITTLLF